MNIKDLKISLNGIDENGEEREYNISNFLGKMTILYFYPKDNTSGCTKEACDFTENKNRWLKYAQVIGVSPDSIKSHISFREKHGINFPLLSDTDKILAKTIGAWGEKTMYGKKYMGIIRSTFLIDDDGNVIKEWKKVKVNGHVDEVIKTLEQN